MAGQSRRERELAEPVRKVRSTSTSPPSGARAIQRALDILNCFSLAEPSNSLTELAGRTGLTMPTCHRIVKTLQSNGYLGQNEANGHYVLGPSVMRLSEVFFHRDDNLASVAHPYLDRLRRLTTETVGLHTPFEGERICIAELVGFHSIRMATGVGHVYPLYVGAAGKALLAWMPEETVDRVVATGMPPVGPSKVDEVSLRRDLERVRERGYAVSEGETVAGARALAAPVFAASRIVAAINITGPSHRWSKTLFEEAVPDLLEASRDLSRLLGSEFVD